MPGDFEEDRRAAAYRKELRNKPEEELDWSEQMSLSSPSLGYWGPDQWDWEALALERDPGSYFPASPLYQPFSALFGAAPDEALRLIKAMTNHAVEAWRQLHRLRPAAALQFQLPSPFPGASRRSGEAFENIYGAAAFGRPSRSPRPILRSIDGHSTR